MENTVLITGANRGIGLELAKLYSKRGAKVIALVRNSSPELSKLKNIEVIEDVDVTNLAALRRAKDIVGNTPIDILINNAGVWVDEDFTKFDDVTSEHFMRAFDINSMGPIKVTSAFLKNLQNGSKVGVITSRMGSIKDNTSGGRYGYRMTKAAANAATVSMAHDLKSRGVAVAVLHPGYVQTDMTHHNGDITPDTAAEGLAKRLDELSLSNTGTFWHQNGEVLPW
jgi:NAD(P)-dependent dehydrogenase (short-subunit alcohol dehydrogenase family)